MPNPKIKGRIHLDEVELRVGKTCWNVNVVDSRAKYTLWGQAHVEQDPPRVR